MNAPIADDNRNPMSQSDRSKSPATTVFHVTGIDKSGDGMASQELQVGQFFIGLVSELQGTERTRAHGHIFDTGTNSGK